jgi:hypothetical protein
MSKAEKKKKDKKAAKTKTTKTATSDAPARKPSSGRLVSLDGASGAFLLAETPRLARLVCGEGDPAWSQWDASNTFLELRMLKAKNLTPTPRVLILLYASDLLFRVRWEIEPTLGEGRSVVVAPYVHTAIGFGVAAGLQKEWLEELFHFAPKADSAYRLKEKKKAKKEKKSAKNADGGEGFVEFCCQSLARTIPGWDPAAVRSEMVGYLKGLEKHDLIQKFGKKA